MVLFVAGIVRSLMAIGTPELMIDLLYTGLVAANLIIYLLMRSFPLKAQDRAIRAEENFRHYLLTGKTLNPELKVPQIVALRFAPDEEFVALAERAVKENMKPDDIKKAIKNWKADYYRV
ncbi:MAG: hypothetical protein HBSAPP04_28090 [Ignavibacteriaceae bacterium]|nr:MAG: hypothetical protein HBSAPP04_28090 [Ignavibacteriaceae bacterium]